MKNYMFFAVLVLALAAGCSLDYENKNAVSPDNVWTDKDMTNSFLANIYGSLMPGWPVNANGTDEGMNRQGDMDVYTRGQITVDNIGVALDYSSIDNINYFLDHIEGNTALTETDRRQMRGQALFWRAWDYWQKVFAVGGVPLILHTQDVSDMSSLLVSRSKTSECVRQIVADLDEAIANLPDTWDGDDYGRIDKCAAMAFKGRVLLCYASPLFNPDNDQSRWQQAYDANKSAVDFLASAGKGLYQGDFADIWYDEQNREVIMVNQYYYPDHPLDYQNGIRPMPLTRDDANLNEAILPLLMAFPKADGTPLTLDAQRLAADAEYNDQFMTDFYTNRDPRFYATVFCPGTEYPASDVLTDGRKYWNASRAVADPSADGGVAYISLVPDELGVSDGASTGFFQMKGLDKTLTRTTIHNAQTDWVEIRYAEVLMNYGECANELGKSDEALQVLYDIRKRAGIEAGTGNYGITAATQGEIRQTYMTERLIEFAYEGKRFNDLRRWKKFDYLNGLKYRSCVRLVIKDYGNIGSFDWTKDMYDPDVRKLFRMDYIECVDGNRDYQFNLDTNHWFYPISKNALDRNSNLEQNDEWGGSFNPLE